MAIKPEQQFDYVTGENANDMELVIDSIELLYRGIYDAFVIVSSNSDYTSLAINYLNQVCINEIHKLLKIASNSGVSI